MLNIQRTLSILQRERRKLKKFCETMFKKYEYFQTYGTLQYRTTCGIKTRCIAERVYVFRFCKPFDKAAYLWLFFFLRFHDNLFEYVKNVHALQLLIIFDRYLVHFFSTSMTCKSMSRKQPRKRVTWAMVRVGGVFLTLSFVFSEPVAEISGAPEIFVSQSSNIFLTCTIKYCPEPPSFIRWYHNERVKIFALGYFRQNWWINSERFQIINYDSPRGGVNVITEKGDITISYLIIQKAQIADSGRFYCCPSNARKANVMVHVVHGEYLSLSEYSYVTSSTDEIISTDGNRH